MGSHIHQVKRYGILRLLLWFLKIHKIHLIYPFHVKNITIFKLKYIYQQKSQQVVLNNLIVNILVLKYL